MDYVEDLIEKIRPNHAKLVTQLQIIDTQVDLKRFLVSLRVMACYVVLLSMAGYIFPSLIFKMEIMSFFGMMGILIATLMCYVLLFYRMLCLVKSHDEYKEKKQIAIKRMFVELSGMGKHYIRYKPHLFNDILSLGSDLKLDKKITQVIVGLVEKIELYNDSAKVLSNKIDEFFEELKLKFCVNIDRKYRGTVNICDIDFLDKNFDWGKIKSSILDCDDAYFAYNRLEMHSERMLFSIDLKLLNKDKRKELCESLDLVISRVQSIPEYSKAVSALNDFQQYRSIAIESLKKQSFVEVLCGWLIKS